MDKDLNIFDLKDDTPILNATYDVFGRSKIVDAIVKTINIKSKTNHSCFVIGIYAQWGEGKTSVLNLIEERLLSQKDNIVISKFNPWFFKDQESLLFDFFNSIDGGNISEAFLNNLRKYGPIVSMGISGVINMFSPGAGSILNKSVTKFIDKIPEIKISPIERKRELSRNIVDSKKHLVILIDDVDRLDKEETHALFKLIKQTADFDNTIFIVAMDKNVVAKSLCSKFENGDIQSGYNFIEKIVQMQLFLPKIQQVQILDFLNTKFDNIVEIMKEYSKLYDENDFIQAKNDIKKFVLPLITTAREVIQYMNILSYSIPLIYKEINISDLCLLEALKVFHPNAYNVIRSSKHIILMNDRIKIYEVISGEKIDKMQIENTEKKEFLDLITKGCPSYKLDNLNRIIGFLLRDYILSKKSNKMNVNSNKRLCSSCYFDKYFMYDTPSNIISEKLIDEMLCVIKSAEFLSLKDYFEEILVLYDETELSRVVDQIIYLRDSNGLNNKHISKICIAISLFGVNNKEYNIPIHQRRIKWEIIIAEIINTNIKINNNRKTIKDYKTIIEVVEIVCQHSSPYFSLIFFNEIKMPKHDSDTLLKLNQIAYKSINRFINSYSEKELFNLDSECIIKFFSIWKSTNLNEYQDFIQRNISQTDFDVVKLFNLKDYIEEFQFNQLFDNDILYEKLSNDAMKNSNLRMENERIHFFMNVYESVKKKK